MSRSEAVNRSSRSGSQDGPPVLETRAGRIYRENLTKMSTSRLTKWSAKVAGGSAARSERPA